MAKEVETVPAESIESAFVQDLSVVLVTLDRADIVNKRLTGVIGGSHARVQGLYHRERKE